MKLPRPPTSTTGTVPGRRHEVWFEDARSIQAKLELVREFELAGVSFWHIGTYFAQAWEVLNASFQVNKIRSPR